MSQLFNFNGRWMTRDQFVKERYDENPESEVLEEAVEKNKEVSKTSKPSKKNKSKK